MLLKTTYFVILWSFPALIQARPLEVDNIENNEDIVTTTFPPGPPEILSDNYDYDSGFDMSYDDPEELLNNSIAPVSVEIDAFVSRSPNVEVKPDDVASEVSEDEQLIYDLLDIDTSGAELGLVLTWWHILLLCLACLLVTCLFCYITSCCYLTLDCCSDPYWGCCLCCTRCVAPAKPPPHILARSRDTGQVTVSNSKYSLNENSTAPRTRGSSKSLTTSNRGSSKSVNIVSSSTLNVADRNKVRKYSVDKQRGDNDEETQLLASSGARDDRVVISPSVNTLSSSTCHTATLSSVKSVRNYKRTRPASQLNGDSFAKNAGLSESLPHVYQDGTGSYFSWLHLFGRSKRRYNVSRRKKPRGNVSGPNNNIYRQTRYRHIAESRNSAVIPVKIAKRSSTASTYNNRPLLTKRSRSAETVDSQDDFLQPTLETVSSEKHLPRSRLSANLAQLEARNAANKTAPTLEYNLQFFEKSLMKSKETTL